MHHVKNDKRSQVSAKAVYKALTKLLKSKPFDSITVSSICEDAHISRATFYRNFDIVEDVLAWHGNILIQRVLTNYLNLPTSKRIERFADFALSYALEEVEYIEILSRTNKMHLIEPTVLTVLQSAPLNFDIHESPYIKYAIYAKVASFFGIINCWVTSGKKESVEDIKNNLKEIAKYIHTIDIQN